VRHLWLAIDRSPRRENAPANPPAPANRRRRLPIGAIMSIMPDRPTKITFAEMRDSGLAGY
jgi:hypothetical protein